MIYLKRQIKKIYNQWGNDDYIFEKVEGKYKSITYKDFIEKSLGIAKYLLDNGADANIKDHNGKTAFDSCSEKTCWLDPKKK